MWMAEELAMFNQEERRLWWGWVDEGNHCWRPLQIFEEPANERRLWLKSRSWDVGEEKPREKERAKRLGEGEGPGEQLQRHSPKWLLFIQFFQKSTFLRYNLHTIKSIYFKCTRSWILTNKYTHVMHQDIAHVWHPTKFHFLHPVTHSHPPTQASTNLILVTKSRLLLPFLGFHINTVLPFSLASVLSMMFWDSALWQHVSSVHFCLPLRSSLWTRYIKFVYPFICWRTFDTFYRFLLSWSYCYHLCASVAGNTCFHFWWAKT